MSNEQLFRFFRKKLVYMTWFTVLRKGSIVLCDIAENIELRKILSSEVNFSTSIGIVYISHFLHILPIFLKTWFSFLIEISTEETVNQMIKAACDV